MRNEKQRARFVATSVLLLLLAAILAGGSFALAFAEKYPSADSLVYEACTFARCERISLGKYGHCYFIYVEEYGQPLEIDNISIRSVDRDVLEKVKVGDTVIVSRDEDFCLYAISYGDKTILSYEDFLATQDGNDAVGAVFVGVFSLFLIGLFVANVILYRKTGRSFPLR